MVVDTSVLIAILFDEPDALRIEAALAVDEVRLLSAASLLETSIVLKRGMAILEDESSICCSTRLPWRSLQSPRTRSIWPEKPIDGSAKDGILRH